jgi:hypothetical protein
MLCDIFLWRCVLCLLLVVFCCFPQICQPPPPPQTHIRFYPDSIGRRRQCDHAVEWWGSACAAVSTDSGLKDKKKQEVVLGVYSDFFFKTLL